MKSRMGSLLEKNVKKIFELAGFKPELNKIINNYEIDVYVKYKTIDLIIECKQYEKSTLALRNLIHQWDSKNKEIKATKILLVIVGVTVDETAINLAKKYGITIWDEKKLNELFNEVIEKKSEIKNKILIEAGLRNTIELDGEIKNVCKKNNCSKNEAIMLLRGEITEEKLKKIKELQKKISDSKKDVSAEDFRLLKNNSKYYGFPFKRVFEMMITYKIPDKKIARLFVDNKGGTYNGKKYSRTKIKKMKLLMEELGYSLSELDDKSIDKITFVNLKRIIKLLKMREDLSFEEASNLILKRKLTITQAQKIEKKEQNKEIEITNKKRKIGFLSKIFG